jgi:hypothetical protein
MTSMLQTTQASGDEMDVLFYETQMMNRAFASLRTASTDVFKNALLESFLLHLRNLIYFFREPNPKFPDDLTYAAFRDSKGDTLKPICLKIAQRELDAINKHLQHMTMARLQQRIFLVSGADVARRESGNSLLSFSYS